jgi:hypothetical protein
MAKESMKARDAKRLKLITKYKSKRDQLKKEGDMQHWTSFRKMLHLFAIETDVKSQVVHVDTWASSDCQEYNSVI